MVNVESSDVGPRSATIILVFDAHRALRRGGQAGMLAPPGLNPGLLVSGDDKFVVLEGFTFPGALVQIQNTVGLEGEFRVSREDPTAVIPGAKGVFMEPPPNSASGDGGNQSGLADLAGNVRSVPAGKGNPIRSRQLASQRLANLLSSLW